MREAALSLVNVDPTLRILVIGPYAFLEPIRERTGLVGKDGHAGSIETSEMLVIAEDRVHLDRMPQVTRPPLSRFQVFAHPRPRFRRASAEIRQRSRARLATERRITPSLRSSGCFRSLDAKGTEG